LSVYSFEAIVLWEDWRARLQAGTIPTVESGCLPLLTTEHGAVQTQQAYRLVL